MAAADPAAARAPFVDDAHAAGMPILPDFTADPEGELKKAPPSAGQNGTVECSDYISIPFGNLKIKLPPGISRDGEIAAFWASLVERQAAPLPCEQASRRCAPEPSS